MSLCALSVFLSAFLLFLVQPLLGKYLLPWFGGTSAFWSTAMFLFQLLLSGGYGYAYWLSGKHRCRTQAILHLILIGTSLGIMLAALVFWHSPILPDSSWRMVQSSRPTWTIIRTLTVAIGLPFVVLSCNSPLMQSWSSRLRVHPSPYRLYALSNAGSLLALVSYPTLIEPNLSLRLQAHLWSCGYLVFCILTGTVAIMAARAGESRDVAPGPAEEPTHQPAKSESAFFTYAAWIALPACSSVMLLATTSQICQEVAVIPFLWILPLATYLLSFVLVFSQVRFYSRVAYTVALLPASVLLVWLVIQTNRFSIGIQVLLYVAVLFICCMICHGELEAIKPKPSRLTLYYLCISIGGVAGAAFVGLVAQKIFRGLWELPLGLLATWVLLAGSLLIRRPPGMSAGKRLALLGFLATATGLVAVSVLVYIRISSGADLEVRRDFYGVMRVRSVNAGDPRVHAHQLLHGSTVHGFQYVDPSRQRVSTAYFTERSGIGLALQGLLGRSEGVRVGVLGLGVGTLATYGRKGDTYRFYEIDPEVARLADSDYFTFMRRSSAQVQVVIGDARIALESELSAGRPQEFDLLAVDTFTGDAIPTHLLTSEAFLVYLGHLKQEGVLALHISNRYLNLAPVVWRLAEAQHLAAAQIDDAGDGGRCHPSTWMLLTRDPGLLSQPAIRERAGAGPPKGKSVRLWTDDYSNLFSVLR